MKLQVIAIMAAVMPLLLSLATVVPTMIASASAQLSSSPSTSSQQPSTDVDSSRIYESEEDGFRLQIPQGWVIHDDNMPPPSEEQLGHNEVIAILCLESEALPGIGGDYNCLAPANRTYEISIER